MRNKLKLLLILVGLFLGFVWLPQAANAAASPRVLLAYDSQNIVQKGNQKIDALQRLLSSLNIKVNTIKIQDYRKGMLKNGHYNGVITMINWSESQQSNTRFMKDRDKYSGIKLHIGNGLSTSEVRELNTQTEVVYHQQFAVKDDESSSQLLPFSSSMILLKKLPKSAKIFGNLVTQTSEQKRYPYGVVNNNCGYLPSFDSDGLSFLLAGKLISKLFKQSYSQSPVLTITGVTPYSNLNRLNQLSKQLYQAGIPFIVSTTSVGTIANYQAFAKFASSLRLIEQRGGVVFLKTPATVRPSASSGPELSGIIQNNLVSLGQQDVFPVGIVAENYWNQDAVYRQDALIGANTRILLPNPSEFNYAKQDNRAGIAQKSFYGISINRFVNVERMVQKPWPMPVALTTPLPKKTADIRRLITKIAHLNVNLFDPLGTNEEMKFSSGAVQFSQKGGNYYLNNSQVQINKPRSGIYQSIPSKQISPINKFFKTQSNIMFVLFTIVLIVFIVFIWIGRRIYHRMFTDE